MRILITGATGFVGGHVAAALAAGNQIVAPARGAGPLPPGVERVPFAEDLAGLVAAQRPDAVVNLLGIISGDFGLVHVEYTRRLLAGASAAGVKKFVQMSALGASANSPSAYQRSKAAAERLVAAAGIPYAIARP
jgi:NADH dehydrogenase